MRLPRYLAVVALALTVMCGRADASPTIAQSNAGFGAPSSNLFTSTYTSTPPAGDQGVLVSVCGGTGGSTFAAPTGWTAILPSDHVGSIYIGIFGKTLTTSDTTQSNTCTGTKYGYTIYDISSAGIITAGSVTAATSTTATGSVTYTTPKAGGLLLEIYSCLTGSGGTSAITDSASVTTSLSATTGAPGNTSVYVASFVSTADPFTGVTQPYTNSGTWNHSNNQLASVDLFVAPLGAISQPAWWPAPFDRIQ